MEKLLGINLFSADYWATRVLFQRGLALVYIIAFVAVLKQFLPLLGERGLTPVARFLEYVNFKQAPSIFHFYYSDKFLIVLAGLGLFLSIIALLGLSERGPFWVSMLTWFLLWAIYLSVVNVGQTWYSFGWESMLLEAGFLSIFLGASPNAAPLIIIFLLRWMLFRLEFGAGMIKLRGDECWRDLTCMNYHHETQPMPNPLSWYFHNMPTAFHKLETFMNFFFQLIVPFGLFLPQPIAGISGGLIILSQLYLMVSGNYSFLNSLTLILAISAIPGAWIQKVLPLAPPAALSAPPTFQWIVLIVGAILIIISVRPLINLFSRYQLMNYSYNPFHIVNSYGAFGSVTKERYEIILEGTRDEELTDKTQWLEYEFKGKPGDLKRAPPQVAPYHMRLDWLMWFAAMEPKYNSRSYPWFEALVEGLLRNNRDALSLIRHNPFQESPPKFVRALLYKYNFTNAAERRQTGAWWKRELMGEYLPPAMLRFEPQK